MAFSYYLLIAAALSARQCNYTTHLGVSYLGPDNVIECRDGEFEIRCRARCDADDGCANFGVYTSGGRCCTKRNNKGAAAWPGGSSFVKEIGRGGCPFSPPGPPPPAPLPEGVTVAFTGNESWQYLKSVTLLSLSKSELAVAFQASATSEGGPSQRILFGVSPDGGATFPSGFKLIIPSDAPSDRNQWQPILFAPPGSPNILLFYNERSEPGGGTPTLLYLQESSDRGDNWSGRRLILNATELGRPVVWAINKIVVTVDGSWVLPCNYGCGNDTEAFALWTADQGKTWAVGRIPGTGPSGTGGCPESGMAPYGSAGGIFAILRTKHEGFAQSCSVDSGRTWAPALASSVNDGATSKPALQVINNGTMLLAYNSVNRLEMLLASSHNGGETFLPFRLIDSGIGLSEDCYPTIIMLEDNAVLIGYGAYRGGPGNLALPPEVRIARVDLT